MRLAGTYHPIPYLLERLVDYLPGIQEAYGLWKDYDNKIYTSHDTNPLQEALKIKAQAIRSVTIKSCWSKPEPLFERGINSKRQLNLTDEGEMNVLHLYFNSSMDAFNDVLIIHFPKNLFLKSLNLEFQGITTKEKGILSNLLGAVLSTEYNKVIQEREFLMQVEKINQRKDLKIEQLSSDLKTTEQLYSSAIRTILNGFKEKYENETKKTYVFSDEVVFKLAKERLAFEDIKNIISGAIYLAYNLNLSASSIRITEDHIQFPASITNSNSVRPASQENDKVKLLLNNYEEAALSAMEKGLMVNGKNIANHLNPPVTPPAITDAVKKNKRKIAYLLQQYPERWVNIREGIRPISRLDQESKNLRKTS